MGNLARNIKVHDQYAPRYQAVHAEIYNRIEQARLREIISRAKELISTTSSSPLALDFGCGLGNLTHAFLDSGIKVVAADISSAFLKIVAAKFGSGHNVQCAKLNGTNLSNFGDCTFDCVGAYSVLHHVPDYIGIVEELARVLKPGGVLIIDHEVCPSFWSPSEAYRQYISLNRKVLRRANLRKFFDPLRYYHRFRRFLNPRYQPYGDIHVWPDDHIEWTRIEAILRARCFDILHVQDYLLYRGGDDEDLYYKFRSQCSDMRVLLARRDL